jgi:hypothetical protein
MGRYVQHHRAFVMAPTLGSADRRRARDRYVRRRRAFAWHTIGARRLETARMCSEERAIRQFDALGRVGESDRTNCHIGNAYLHFRCDRMN